MNLIDRPVNRVFTFGCSFTAYEWPTWPQIVAYDLGRPLFNFGRSGAGNMYMSNMFSQAKELYSIDSNDLVMFSWTNVCREDRYVDRWITPGNVFTQGEYPEKWVRKFVDPFGMLMRDLSTINLVRNTLESIGCQYHFVSMVDIVEQYNQGDDNDKLDKESVLYKKLTEIYKDDIDAIQATFYKVLWDDDIHANKFADENILFDGKFNDGHPLPKDHLRFLETVFNTYNWKSSTKDKVNEINLELIRLLKEFTKDSKRQMAIYEFDHNKKKPMYDLDLVQNRFNERGIIWD